MKILKAVRCPKDRQQKWERMKRKKKKSWCVQDLDNLPPENQTFMGRVIAPLLGASHILGGRDFCCVSFLGLHAHSGRESEKYSQTSLWRGWVHWNDIRCFAEVISWTWVTTSKQWMGSTWPNSATTRSSVCWRMLGKEWFLKSSMSCRQSVSDHDPCAEQMCHVFA